LNTTERIEMGDFAARIADQEWWSGFGFWVLVAGLIGDVIVLGVPEHKRWLEKSLGVFFIVVVIIGCAFEHEADNRISDLVSQDEAAAGVKIASAQDQAATARADVALTIAKYGDLDKFVREKTRSIEQGVGNLEGREAALNVALLADEKRLAKVTAGLEVRTLSKPQWDLIQTLHGRVKAVNIAWEQGVEPSLYASQFTSAFSNAGIAVHVYFPAPGAAWTGALLGVLDMKHAESDPLYSVLNRIVGPMSTFDLRTVDMIPGVPKDVPLFCVGERFPMYSKIPYFGPHAPIRRLKASESPPPLLGTTPR
jgi:hypothetical protein